MTAGGYTIGPGGTGIPTGGEGTLQKVVTNSLTILMVFAVIFVLFFLIWGGIQWITSGGDKEKLDAARKRITFAIIGFIVILLSFLVINTLGNFLGVSTF